MYCPVNFGCLDPMPELASEGVLFAVAHPECIAGHGRTARSVRSITVSSTPGAPGA